MKNNSPMVASPATPSPRIWRSPKSNFYGDECGESLTVYDDTELAGIRACGFDGIWLRGRLYDLMNSQVLPELNRSGAAERITSLQRLITRAARHDLKVYLFFNEPLALPSDSPFWDNHLDLAGQRLDSSWEGSVVSLCTSTPLVRQFMDQAVRLLLASLPGLGGVILITASEHHTHCWSHHFVFGFDDGYAQPVSQPLDCPRCRERGPAAIVLELLDLWKQAADAVNPGCQVIAWNWSWSMWYPDPQAEIVAHLPAGVSLLLDWERGGTQTWPAGKPHQQRLIVDEYSLAYAGPSERFLSAQQVSGATPVLAKLQIGTTHELATVPNLPLLATLHAKLVGLYRQHVTGFMACWNFGCSRTLNSFATGLYFRSPHHYQDRARFFADLAREYLGLDDAAAVSRAWEIFSEAFLHYPFSNRMLYWSPLNCAPAYPLSLEYRADPMVSSWQAHPRWGDRLDDCLVGFEIDKVIDAVTSMAKLWRRGLGSYRSALVDERVVTDEQMLHRRQEWACARMIGVHLASFGNILKFHRWRTKQMQHRNLAAPCRLFIDEEAVALFRQEMRNVTEATELLHADHRLGYHEECQTYVYGIAQLEQKHRELLSHI